MDLRVPCNLRIIHSHATSPFGELLHSCAIGDVGGGGYLLNSEGHQWKEAAATEESRGG